MPASLARRSWDLSWQQSHDIPAGPVELWIVMFTDDGEILGAGPCTERPSWEWRDGKLSCAYGTVHMDVLRPGRYARGIIVAVSPGSRQYAPYMQFNIDDPEKVRPGMTMTVIDGAISLTPDARQR